MCKVDEQNETKDDEQGCTDERNIVAPEDEETVGDEEGSGDKDEPKENFGSPPAVLDGCSGSLGVFDADEKER